ncbi:uncharacterized protein SAPINGB_P001745 [Magnusiomyces paraingens]|uniref:Sec39 domain-containing protein n=1 Tax=Magnusiomyces paraingens TaxID=2606893 RepID=A0A5E8BG19_9ASCO|nr:uncharacterized protein SAPINGB_P001745 [Saprochaete ingens]VVT48371.1 unnamed protein product [Saprochaete ingens]
MSFDIHIAFADFASKGEIDSLISLVLSNQENLSKCAAYALLLCFLPEGLHTKNNFKLIKAITNLPNILVNVTTSTFIEDISLYVYSRIESIGWEYPIFPLNFVDDAKVLLYTFIKCYIRNNDAAKRQLDFNLDFLLVEENDFEELFQWKSSSVDVLSNFRKYYSSHNQPWISLYEFECAHPEKVVPFLLQYSNDDNIFRDINDLVIPYISFYDAQYALWKWIGSDTDSVNHLELLESLIRHGVSVIGSEKEQRVLIEECLFPKYKKENFDWKGFDEKNWSEIYESLKWLQSDIFSKISDSWIDKILLTGALSSGNFTFVQKQFFSRSCSLPLTEIKTSIISTFYLFFDSATNGNKTRGSMKNAVQCIKLLQNFKDNEDEIYRAEALLSATDELSKYTLYLSSQNSNTQNMPMLPKQIRNYPNKFELIYRVLELNSKAYLDYDKLVSILKNLIYSSTEKNDVGTSHNFNSSKFDSLDLLNESISFQVRKMCIEAALVDSNFEKAYEFAIPHLVSTSTTSNQKENASTVDDFGLKIVSKETESWASLFQIGKYISPFWESDIPIDIIDKKMNALAYSLKICPQEQIPVILHTWQRCDTLRNATLKKFHSQKIGSAFNQTVTAAMSSAPSLIPTNFKKVLSSTASSLSVSSSPGSFGFLERDNENFTHFNTRKRDQLSNLFVSGLGWAIGANQRK